MEWTSFDRVKTALEHKEPDQIPFDLGGSVLSGMNRVAYQKLRRYLGLPEKETEIIDPMQQLAKIEQDLLERLKVDVRCVDPGIPQKNLLGTKISANGDYYSFKDEWGIKWSMPVSNGLYFDMRGHPLADIDNVDELKKFPWPDPEDDGRFLNMKERADRFVYEEQKAYVLGRHAAGIFETALWMRGFENFFMDMAINPGFAEALLEVILENKMKYWMKAIEMVGENVLVISEADDIATQNGLMISKEMYLKFIHPVHKKLFSFIKAKAKSKVYIFYHCCGAIKEMIPYFILEGADILNPVQVSAKDMDTKELKRLYGGDITFWGEG